MRATSATLPSQKRVIVFCYALSIHGLIGAVNIFLKCPYKVIRIVFRRSLLTVIPHITCGRAALRLLTFSIYYMQKNISRNGMIL
nr:MAG TPA: hypothetical protein [Caudoviricetes sp.]